MWQQSNSLTESRVECEQISMQLESPDDPHIVSRSYVVMSLYYIIESHTLHGMYNFSRINIRMFMLQKKKKHVCDIFGK